MTVESQIAADLGSPIKHFELQIGLTFPQQVSNSPWLPE